MLKTKRKNEPPGQSLMVILFWCAAFSLTACTTQIPEQPQDSDVAFSAPQNLVELAIRTRARTYDAIWETLDEHYVYAGTNVVDLESLQGAYNQEALGAQDYSSFQATMNEMFTFFPEGSVSWQTRDERIQLEVNSSVPSGYQGIGAFIAFRPDPEPHVVLMAIIAGSPAESVGLKPRDSIFALNGDPFLPDETVADVAARVRGPAGTTVTLTVQSPGEALREVEVTRGPISATGNRLQARFFENGNILYVDVPRAGYAEMPIDFVKLLETFSEGGEIGGIILDLRIATTGGGWPIEDMLSLFLEGQIGESFTNAESIAVTITAQDFFNSQDTPLAVLIGPDTQGMPELFAATIQTAKRGVVFGLPSPGNIEIARSYPMPDGSQLTLNIASFTTVDGVDLGITGVLPDVPINLYWETQSLDNDEVINSALEALRDSGSE